MGVNIYVKAEEIESDLLVWVLTTYGLPGHKFTYHPNRPYMKFSFDDAKDAMLFQLKVGGIWEAYE